MLRLNNIKKDYYVGDMTVHALKGIDVSFRKSEFVSILGPSGCGKTTMLNIIGGLDKYTDGDLFIAGRSTKEFNDRDWDIYRNHRIGFIFQSYNLIPHQTILGNVELALTIAGISKEERRERAKKALDRVGLVNQYSKKPNQLSGGQCQRVAIARALVNEPEILLADEPTGALDTETSIQIMNLIKEISKEKLVIMVTHNPDLALQYSTRIVRCLDGLIIDDSNPFDAEDEIKEIEEINKIKELENKEEEISGKDAYEAKKKAKEKEKAKMSFRTAFRLSARNLLSKFSRTLLIGIAGSIGIIGVSTVLAVSTGVHDYIDGMQDDMLSGNPITIEKSGIDYAALMDSSSFKRNAEALKKEGVVNVRSLVNFLVTNEKALTSLTYNNTINKDYVNYVKSMPEEYYSAIQLNYGIDITQGMYTDYVCGSTETKSQYSGNISLTAINAAYSRAISHLAEEYVQYADLVTGLSTPMSQSVGSNDYILSQYNLVAGSMPQNTNDVIVVLGKESTATDLLLAQLGYYSQEDFYNMVYCALYEKDPDKYVTFKDLYESSWKNWKSTFSYDELLEKEYTWYPNDVIYEKSTNVGGNVYDYQYKEGSWSSYDKNDQSYLNDTTGTKGIKLNVCGVVVPKDDISYGSLTSGILYKEELARYMISVNSKSQIAKDIRTAGTDLESKAQVFGTDYKEVMQVKVNSSITADTYYERNGSKYTLTSDTTFKENKNYFVKITVGEYSFYQKVVFTNSKVPSNTYYVKGDYVKTSDTSIVEGKNYYLIVDDTYSSMLGKKYFTIAELKALLKIDDTAISTIAQLEEIVKASPLKDYLESLKVYEFDSSIDNYTLTTSVVFEEGITYYALPTNDIGVIFDLPYYWETLYVDVDNHANDKVDSGEAKDLIYIGEANNMNSVVMQYFGMSSSAKTLSLAAVGGNDLPVSIMIYPVNFEQKDNVTKYLDAWNDETIETVEYYDYNFNFEPTTTKKTMNYSNSARQEIKYTDNVGLIINMINTMVDIVTYALIAFTALSLLVSSVMIAIITYVSVMERIKEIGVIRALGGRKKDVSHLFNAETFIIGLASGLIGILFTYFLQIIINIIVRVASNGSVKSIAHLKLTTAGIMILISIFLTCISGLIPSRSAAKKDPVVALRTE